MKETLPLLGLLIFSTISRACDRSLAFPGHVDFDPPSGGVRRLLLVCSLATGLQGLQASVLGSGAVGTAKYRRQLGCRALYSPNSPEGDHVRPCADHDIPVVAHILVHLIHRRGVFPRLRERYQLAEYRIPLRFLRRQPVRYPPLRTQRNNPLLRIR